jgi:hypothetical protein
LKAVNLHEFRLLLENTAIKQVRAQRAPMSKAWNLVFQCPGGDYALHETSGEPRAFEDLHDAVLLLEQEGLKIDALHFGVRT